MHISLFAKRCLAEADATFAETDVFAPVPEQRIILVAGIADPRRAGTSRSATRTTAKHRMMTTSASSSEARPQAESEWAKNPTI